MLQKMFLKVGEYIPEYRSRAVVFLADTMDEFLAAEEILKNHGHKFRGVQLKSSLFVSLPQLDIVTAVSIVLEDVLCLDDIFKKCQRKYMELIVPYSLFSADLLKRCERAERVIVSFSNEEELAGLNEMFKAFITWKRFPLMLNVPLCKIDVRDVKHAAEIYLRRMSGVVKPMACGGCLLQRYCSFNGKGFVPVPLVDAEKYAGVLTFLSDEDSTARF